MDIHKNAPEIQTNLANYTFESDIWSIGIAIIEMCFGKVIFIKDELINIKNDIISEKFKSFYYKNELVDFVCCCLQADPSNRKNIGELSMHPFICSNLKHKL